MGVDATVGTEVAGYRIERVLGRGGMSVVYLAEHLRLGRKVALKLLAPDLASDERFRERFLRESTLAASLDHPNVIPIYDADDAGGVLFIAMRYVEGTDLRRLLAEEGALDPVRAISIVSQVAAALDAAHRRGLVHRDVKPGNILLAGEYHVYLSDFGLTKQTTSQTGLTQTGQLVGTLDYVAPEQIQGQEVDGRTDVYSLGCVLFECITGRKPYEKDTEVAVLWSHMHDPPPKLGEPAVDAVLAKAMAKKPADRYATAGELAADARRAFGISSGEIALPPAVGRRLDRRLLALGAVAAAVVAVAVVIGTRGGGKSLVPVAPNSVAAIDPRTNKVVAVVPVGADPQAMTSSGDSVVVVNRRDHTLSAIDTKTRAVRTLAAGSSNSTDVISGFGSTWVSNSGDGTISHIQNNFVETIRVGDRYSTFGEDLAAPITVAGGAVWVLYDASPYGIVRIDPGTGRVAGRVPGFTGATDLVGGFGALWVADYPSRAVERVDLRTRSVTSTITIAGSISGGPLAVTAGEGSVWAVVPGGLQGRSRVWRIDPRTNAITDTIQTSDDSTGIAAGAGALWVMHSREGKVSRIDPRTNTTANSIEVGNHPSGITVAGGYVWVAIDVADSFTAYEPGSGS